MSGLPQLHVCRLRLKTLSKLTGFSFHPVVTAETSSYKPAMSATCPGRDSVGTRVWETPKVPCSRTRERRYGARGRGSLVLSARGVGGLGSGLGNDWNALSARSPSPVILSVLNGGPFDATHQQKALNVLRELPVSPRGARACHGQSDL